MYREYALVHRCGDMRRTTVTAAVVSVMPSHEVYKYTCSTKLYKALTVALADL